MKDLVIARRRRFPGSIQGALWFLGVNTYAERHRQKRRSGPRKQFWHRGEGWLIDTLRMAEKRYRLRVKQVNGDEQALYELNPIIRRIRCMFKQHQIEK